MPLQKSPDTIQVFSRYFKDLPYIFVIYLGTSEECMEKHGIFVQLTKPRENRVLNVIWLIGYQFNRSAYSFTDEVVKKIFKA